MKNLIILITLFISSEAALAQTNRWQRKIPGRDYTYEQLMFQRGMINRQRKVEQQLNAPEKLKGQGIEFQGAVEVSTLDGLTQYKTFIRGCGRVDLPKKEDSVMQQLKNGARVRLKFEKIGDCEVSDWEKL